MTVTLNRVTIRNKLNIDIKDCTILYCASEQIRREFGSIDYLLNLKRVDVETGENVRWERTLYIGDVESQSQRSSSESLECSTYFCGYWQVYWTDRLDGKYKIKKNNAQINVKPCNNNNELIITLTLGTGKSERIRLKFKMSAGDSHYFYSILCTHSLIPNSLNY